VPPPGQAPQFSANMPKVVYARAGADIKNIQQPTSDTLFWNADAANVNGIELKATYDPSRYINKPVLSIYPVPVIKTLIGIADNGSYIIPKSFLSLFPPGAFIDISLSRETYVLISYNQFKYIVHAYSYTFILDENVL